MRGTIDGFVDGKLVYWNHRRGYGMINERTPLGQETLENQEELLKKEEKTKKKIRRRERRVREYQSFVLRALILLIVLWALFFQIIGVTRMNSGDMYPRIDAGDFLLFYRLDKDVRAQDVIVLEKDIPNIAGRQLFISRVVAVAGDTVDISDSDRLIVNGNTVIEPNIFYATPRYEGFTDFPLTLGEGQCFVLADSRSGGTDSRYFGPVSRDEIKGTVITIVRRNNL